MKKLALIIFVVNVTLYSFSQYIQPEYLTVEQHLNGDPICFLKHGDDIIIDFNSNDINIGSSGRCSFKIISSTATYSGILYSLSEQNDPWNQRDISLEINRKSKKIQLSIDGTTGLFSYSQYPQVDNVQSNTEQKYAKANKLNEEKLLLEKERKYHEDDAKTRIKIQSLINERNLVAALSEYGKMHFQDSSLKNKIDQEIIKKNQEEDVKTNKVIQSFLKIDNFNAAMNELKKIHYFEEKAKNTIQNAINIFYDTLVNNIDLNVLNKIIVDNKSSFSKVKPGKYNLTLGKEGSVNIAAQDSSNKIAICTNKSYLVKNGFEYPSTYTGEINISIERKPLFPGDSVLYFIPEKDKKKDIYISEKGSYYLGRFGAPLFATKILKPCFYDTELLELNIEIEQLNAYAIKVNGINIFEGKDYFLDKKIVAKKGTGRKIFRAITSPIWGPFYGYYLYCEWLY